MKKQFLLLIATFTLGCNTVSATSRYDVNNDGKISISDIPALVSKIIDCKTSGYNKTYDLNNDNVLDSKDVARLTTLLFNKHEYVDLGLPSGNLWATVNIGATAPEEYGDYFAWGETETKDSYTQSTYKYGNGTSSSIFTKYNNSSTYGTVDNISTLELEDDAAAANWGGLWQMPTNSDCAELRNSTYCTWTKKTQNGINGYLVTSKTNSNSIFLPFAGYVSNATVTQTGSTGYYWSSTLNESGPWTAYCMVIDNSNFTHCNIRSWGRSVRAVIK